MKGIEVLGVMLDVGLSIFTGVMLAEQIGGHLGTSLGASYGIVAASYAIIYTAILFAVGQIPFVGWAITLAVVLADVFGGFSDKLMGWLMNLFGPSDLAVVEGFLEEIWIPSITVTDKDGNGLDVGDRVSISVRTKSKVNVTSGRETYWAQSSWFRPYISIAAPPGSYSNTSYSGIPPVSEMVVESGSNWKTEEYNTSAWIEPGIGMPNFPVNVKLNIDYRLWNVWEHFVFYLVYWEWCRHEDMQEGVSSSHFTTLYYDVLPENIDDFWGWRGVKPLDSDGDGIKDSEENSSSPWRYDSDGDGLNDKYEVSIGTTATSIDTDRDGLNDRFEILYDTDATDRDTDGDGLQDYVEIAGWLIEFTYYDIVITSRVTSDPRVKDTDGDGVDDLLEYWSGLNPRSGDTDGDGVQDVSNPVIPGTVVEFVQRLTIEPDSVDGTLNIIDIACDDEGKLYALIYEGKTYPNVYHYNVSIFDTNMNLESSWLYLLDEMGASQYADFLSTYFSSHIIIDGDKIHITHAYLRVPGLLNVKRSNIKSFYLNGTEVEGYWATREDIEGPRELGLAVDSSGNTYVSRSWNFGHWGDDLWGIWSFIDVYSPNKTHIGVIGEYMDPDNPTLDKFAYITDIAYNPVTDRLYVADNGYTMDGPYDAPNDKIRDDRIAIFETDGTYVTSWVGYNNGTLNIGFDWILSLDIDEGGFVYVLDSRNHRVHKFDPNGIPILSFGGQGLNDGLFEEPPIQLCVNDDLVYVLEPPYIEAYQEYHIHQFNLTYEEPSEIQDPVPDRDGDGLNNTDEETGWEVTFTNTTGTYTLNVTSDPMLPDTDFDGLTDLQEFNAETNPRHTDTDNDGVPDLEEYEWHHSPSMNPRHWDTDGEGLEDATELVYGSDPTLQDTDGDGLTDLEEFLLNSKPNDTDTDDDGLSDYYERYVSNSSLISPDSDGDFLFDGSEDEHGTDPWNSDSDNDTLPDGHEILFGTDPMNWDTDGDNLTDGYELDLWLNPLNNDTDGDGLLDSTELDQGTNPFICDTDFDGIPDDEDTDSNRTIVTSLVLAYDPCNASIEFAEALQKYANVTVVSKDELLSSYKNAPRIVLVGRPDGDGAVGKLVRDLLLDSGEVLTDMLESDFNRFALRHGYWNNTQTIVLLSEPHPMDHLRVLAMLMEKTVTIYPDTVFVDYDTSLAVHYPSGGSLNHSDISYNFFIVDEIDTTKETDAKIYGIIEDASNLSLEITRYNASTTPHSLTNQTGLADYQLALGRYLDIKAGDGLLDNSSVLLESAWIQIFYKDSELDISGNGYIGDPEDIDESSLTLYIYNKTSSDWSQVTENLNWVLDTGVNTTDIQIYGEQYSGYIWAALSHFSLYGLGGMTFNKPPDTSEAYPSIPVLWPPNHKMTNITILGVKDPDGDPVTIRIDSITSDEPTINTEKGNPHAPDAIGLGTSIASLRAERNGGGNGRVYVVNFTASDGRGGIAIGTVAVCVPHNINKICIDDGQKYDATEINFLVKNKKKDPSPVIDSNSDPKYNEEETPPDQPKGQNPEKTDNKEKEDKTSENNSNKNKEQKVKQDKKTHEKMVQIIEGNPEKPEKEKEKTEKKEESKKENEPKEKEDKETKKEK